MGLKILTVEKKGGDTGFAGSVLFNSNRVLNDAKLVDTDDTHFSYAKDINAVIGDKYWVSETLTTFEDMYTSPSVNFYTLPVHADSNDAASDTTNRPIAVDDIAYGIALPSDTSKSLLWVQSGAKVEKVLVNKALGTIEDYVGTGTTTTSSTTTSSTTTA
jgi:hypothetical protein